MSLLATPFKGPTCRVSEMKGNALQSMCPPAFRIVLDLLGLEPIHHLPLSKKTNKAPPPCFVDATTNSVFSWHPLDI